MAPVQLLTDPIRLYTDIDIRLPMNVLLAFSNGGGIFSPIGQNNLKRFHCYFGIFLLMVEKLCRR